ncbi:MAG: hypothetical protein P1S60_00590 [Anaerolineae bacterium]|nr:hypothetical protein [Anaerolineae bacterium]
MTAYRKASIRELTQAAYALDGHFMQGVLSFDEAQKSWMVGNKSLDEWLANHKDSDITLILVDMDEDQPMETRTCRTCGREYIGHECPVCRETRIRLRGR